MQIRGLVLFSTVFLLHLMISPVQSVYYRNFNEWNSDRICKNNEGTGLPLYNVSAFCRRAVANSSGGSCQDVKVELQSMSGDQNYTTHDLKLAVCVIDRKKSKCVALGQSEERIIVFDYNRGKCQYANIESLPNAD